MIKINGEIIAINEFPNKESRYSIYQIEKSLIGYNSASVEFKFEDNKSLMDLFFVSSYLNDKHNEMNNLLVVKYMPYSRMDRENEDFIFTLKYVVDFIELMGFDHVIIYEPHSDVTETLFGNHATGILLSDILVNRIKKDINFDATKDVMVYPDKGAQLRYKTNEEELSLIGEKHRNFTTGRIEKLTISGDDVVKGFRAIIVDDLCSYGGTFMWTANILKVMGASEIYLAVAHAEESIFEGDIFKTDLITAVYTTDSILNGDRGEERLHIK